MSLRRAFIGLAGPIGYDYRNEAPRTNELDYSSPNPILENVLGLLICYDELIFLAPQFCPADMRSLPYVRFVSDDGAMALAAMRALDEYESVEHEDWPYDDDEHRTITKDYQRILQEMTAGRKDFAIDNHTHSVHFGEQHILAGNITADNAVRDLWVNSELGLENVDVVVGTPAQRVLNFGLEKELAAGYDAEHVKRSAAQQLATLYVPNFLDVRGSYHELLEELRARRDAVEFRQFLAEVDVDTNDGAELAKAISRQAFKFVDQQSQRFLKGKNWFESLAVPGVRGALNAIYPVSGTAVAAALQAPLALGERRFKSRSQWAPFVVHLHSIRDEDE